MKNIIIALVFLLPHGIFAKNYELKSPDGSIKVKIAIAGDVSYSVYFDDKEIVSTSKISLTLDNGIVFGNDSKVRKVSRKSVSEQITPVVSRKYKTIKNVYNELKVDFKGRYSLLLRAYNDGIAYRWVSGQKGEYKVSSELATFNFPKDYSIWFPEEKNVYSSQERLYKYLKLSDITPERFCSTGTLVDLDDGMKVYISESDLISYPGMFLKGSSKSDYGLVGKFAGYPLETIAKNDRLVPVTKHANFLAKVNGPRAFPWRVIIITLNDAQLVETEMIYKLATPLKLKDVSWIKPGKVAWDWWNDLNVFGVDFKAGVNNSTYKYFIDFASEYGLDYIILDEGWYDLNKGVLSVIDDIDIPELVEYGKKKNVGVILWVTMKALYDQLDTALEQFERWGVKGIKVDFNNRDDQWMVDFYHNTAVKASKHHLLVDFHGAYKPTGMRRAYPNVITREGLKGMECDKWSTEITPEHDLILPFTRMVAGPMDYTPGAMTNASRDNFRPIWHEPMSQGTRCHQLAMYVVYESPLQMLADSPSKYYKNPDAMKFLSAIPTVWDDTKVIKAKVGDYIAIARRSGDTWYVGAMTNWDARTLKLNFDFLPVGDYNITIWKDGVNAWHHGSDYKMVSGIVKSGDVMDIEMSSGGGWVARITKK